MLTHAQEYHGDARRMHHADQGSYHIAHRVTLGDNESIQLPLASKSSIETSRLANRIATNQSLSHHEDLIWIGEITKFLQIRHQTGVVVPSSSGVDKYDIEMLLCSVGYGVFGDVRCVLTISFFVELYFSKILPFRQFLEVSRMYAKLFDSTGSESIASGNKKVEFVLKEEEG